MNEEENAPEIIYINPVDWEKEGKGKSLYAALVRARVKGAIQLKWAAEGDSQLARINDNFEGNSDGLDMTAYLVDALITMTCHKHEIEDEVLTLEAEIKRLRGGPNA